MYRSELRKIRREKGLTLRDLSNITGISVGYLCHLEKGTRKNPSIKKMNSISMALNKSISEIFFSD